MKRLSLVVGLLGVLLFVGCERTQEQKPCEEGSTTNLHDVVFATVGGKSLTAMDVKDVVILQEKLKRFSRKKKAVESGRALNRCAMRITPKILQAMVLEQELDRRGVAATSESDAETLAKYNRLIRKTTKSVDELARLLDESAETFKETFRRESRILAFLQQEGVLVVADAEIANYYRDLTNQFSRCEAINREAEKKINGIYEKLKNGADWATVATNESEDALLEPSYADNWKNWISAPLQKLEPEELAEAVLPLKAGEFTKPLQHDEGLVIVQLVGKSDGCYDLARILVRSAIDVVFPPREAAIVEIRKAKCSDFLAELMPQLTEDAEITYPLGKKFSYAIWPESSEKKKK